MRTREGVQSTHTLRDCAQSAFDLCAICSQSCRALERELKAKQVPDTALALSWFAPLKRKAVIERGVNATTRNSIIHANAHTGAPPRSASPTKARTSLVGGANAAHRSSGGART
eukprot:6189511-Pleurochrysis_carterae.AAC.1